MQQLQLAIIGSGPAGLTAAIYTARAKIATTLFAGREIGGQLMYTAEVENFPGFPDGKRGPLLMMDLQNQAKRFGTDLKYEEITKVDLTARPFRLWTNSDHNAEADYQAEAVLVATGASSVMLGIPGEKEYFGHGVSVCAVCDAAFYVDKKVYVVGGGDSAMEDALALAKFTKDVTILYRGEAFRASKIMQERVLNHKNIKVSWRSHLREVLGDGKNVRKIKVEINGHVQELSAEGVFLAIGHKPNTSLFAKQLQLDKAGYIELITHDTYSTATSISGVFTAGDVADHRYRQAIVAAGMGAKAALDIEHYLS